MSKSSTMFLQDITVIDHAWVTPEGKIQGESFNLCVEITGKVDEEEQVVIDFSGCKKEIKQIIDDSEFAVDHRLVIVDGFSDFTQINLPYRPERTAFKSNEFYVVSSVDDWYQIIQDDANGNLDGLTNDAKYKRYIGAYICNVIRKELKRRGYPIGKVGVHLSRDFRLPYGTRSHVEFNYVHGLRNSTSYGCQNIVHGHRSFIATDSKSVNAHDVLTAIANDISGIIAWDFNVDDDEPDTIAYVSGRGNFRLDTKINLVLSTETTVENIADYVAKTYRAQLDSIGARTLWISEGLSKGAVVELT